MTGNERPGTPGGPPWSLDLLADLHAGALDAELADRLRPQVEADPEARAVLAALDATVDDLAALADLPPTPMPADVAARIEAALAAEARAMAGGPSVPPTPLPTPPPVTERPVTGPVAPVVDIAEARRRRNRRMGWGAGVLAAAAAVLGIVFVTLPGADKTGGAPRAQSTSTGTATGGAQPPLALSQSELQSGSAPLSAVMGAKDYGPLENPERIKACLAAGGITNAGEPLGVREVQLDGRSGVVVVLPGGGYTKFRLVVLGPDCGASKSQILSDNTIGR
ncbi:hypothetical protein LX15_006326 [Streptoalloteichus tenebrarius]|uniref:Uncharacterized protein n=1 Tax=Streptoalloteichus tenebrarius (strain ATCC 17920 / DSM 40477 / JCM 4838 / CBS 697.72 / NBRC 16177 / NCIMB 11028 / NRRL B-12390 / A12253. 1 / ISP 5477) TaxID=1933 RepID=A0ABT1I4C5_STRSD|nr:hypothetical protein [Streptoalloteichus tenebrarius]MCP2262586.1 hypothetical protein [Streptoalloteichus tenebrarius]BFF01984.1 hypothetical protein GCM10020241_36590 [Streptoalloteichus tenebrarius]